MPRLEDVPDRVSLFAAGLPFPIDDFQREAIKAVEADESVLVAAPTGSGKTVVAEFACWLALSTGAKCFYTTPLKALSNQKFGDLVAQHGARNVGLLTGDNSINGEAPIVVMTTEVLRNMLYEGSSTLNGLRWVVMDEVHYLQDRYRGAVWEEVLIHLAAEVRVVCLSATISNVDEFASWIETLRGETRTIVERKRPVDLHNLVLVGDELHPLLDKGGMNDELARIWAKATASSSRYGRYPPGRPGQRGGNRAPGKPRGGGKGDAYTPTRVDVVKVLEREEMLPAIVFIFSRAGCDDAVDLCARAGIQLTTDEESERIREFATMRCAGIEHDDLRALRFGAFMDGLERGLASHHAGLLPIFKETVEELFAMGLVKVVFATETLSLGINMPARTVVIERLTKFTGEKHEMLTPIDYTQLTGRAGRRGMDDVGYGVTLYNPWVQLEKVAQLATQQNYTLRSSFRPSYNMAVNLVRKYDHETATRLLNSSFAQFVADKNVVKWERDLSKREKDAASLRRKVKCDEGDVMEYFRLRQSAMEAMEDRRGSDEIKEAITRLAPGDVVVADRIGRAVVLEPARIGSGGAPRFTAMTLDRKLRRLGPRDFREPPAPAAKITLRGQSWRSPKTRKGIARDLETLKVRQKTAPAKHSDVKKLVTKYENHPVHHCADQPAHMKNAAKLFELELELSRLTKQVRRRQGTVARTFDQVLGVLTSLGCIEDWQLTGKGELLRRIYNEADLLVVECLARGWLAGLPPEELVAVASSFVYETRRREPPEGPPTPDLSKYEQRIANLYRRLRDVEKEYDVELLKEPDVGFMGQIYEWASGHNLEDILEDRETSAGDFVRSTKQVIDLLQQMRQVVESGALATSLGEAVDRVQRGVVAYSSVV